MTLPADEIREQMISITLEHMDNEGLSGVKARTIAKEAGVSVGTVYNMFGSIDGLIQEANTKILESFADEALGEIGPSDALRRERLGRDELDASEALKERLLSLAEVYMNFVEQNENRWAAMLSYNQGRTVEVLSSDYARLETELFGFLANSLEGTRVGQSEKTRATTARMLWSAVHGIVVLNYIGNVSEESRAYTWEQIEIFVSTFVGGVMV